MTELFAIFMLILQSLFKKKPNFPYNILVTILSGIPLKIVFSIGNIPTPFFLPFFKTFWKALVFYQINMNLLYDLETTFVESGFKFGKHEKNLLELGPKYAVKWAHIFLHFFTK